MSFDITQDFLATLRPAGSSASMGSVPFIDAIFDTLGLAGVIDLVVSSTAPTANQPTTMWLQPQTNSWAGNGQLYLWSNTANAYEAATPQLFANYIEAYIGAAIFLTGNGVPGNQTGMNGYWYVREDVPGGLYQKINGSWVLMPGTGPTPVGQGLNISGDTISLDTASPSQIGGVIPGNGLTVDGAGNLTLDIASGSQLGGIKIGSGFNEAGDGTLSVNFPSTSQFLTSVAVDSPLGGNGTTGNPINIAEAGTGNLGVVQIGNGLQVSGGIASLDIASGSQLGGIKVGSGLSIAGDGTLSTSGGSSASSGTIAAAYSGNQPSGLTNGSPNSGSSTQNFNVASVSGNVGLSCFQVTFSNAVSGSYTVVFGVNGNKGSTPSDVPNIIGDGNEEGFSSPNANGFYFYTGDADGGTAACGFVVVKN